MPQLTAISHCDAAAFQADFIGYGGLASGNDCIGHNQHIAAKGGHFTHAPIAAIIPVAVGYETRLRPNIGSGHNFLSLNIYSNCYDGEQAHQKHGFLHCNSYNACFQYL